MDTERDGESVRETERGSERGTERWTERRTERGTPGPCVVPCLSLEKYRRPDKFVFCDVKYELTIPANTVTHTV